MNKIIIIIILSSIICSIWALNDTEEIQVNEIMRNFTEKLGMVQLTKYISIENETTQSIGGNQLTFWTKVQIDFPDDIILEFADYRIEMDSKQAYRHYNDGYFEKLSDEIADKFRSPLKYNQIYLAKYYKKLTFKGLETIMIDETSFYQIEIADYPATLFINCDDYRLTKINYMLDGNEFTKEFRNFRKFGNLYYPTKIIVTNSEDELVSSIEVKDVGNKKAPNR